jgi:molybdopterin-guanine dinucleotide biosynthesis protein A
MGRPKATIVVGGLTLLQRIALAASTAGLGEPVVIGGDPTWADGLHWVADERPGDGPLAGLLGALDAVEASTTGLVLLACDLLRPDPHVLRLLANRFRAGQDREPPIDAVVPVAQRREVLHAVYHRRLAGPLQAAYDRGERSIDRALRGATVDDVPVTEIPGLAASVRDATRAGRTAEALRRLPAWHAGQVQVIHPHDREWGRKVEPEGVGIWRTAVRAHVTCGALGLLAGTLVCAGLCAADVDTIVTSPAVPLLAVLMFATMFGLIIGGVLTVRPDHEGLLHAVRQAVSAGLWTVVVHPVSGEQRRAAERALRATGAPLARTW